MSCDEVQPELEPWLRGELDEAADAAVRAHVAGCEGCREAARWLGPLAKRLEALPPAPGDEVDVDALADRVLARAKKPAGRQPGSQHPPLGVLKAEHAAAKRNARRAAVVIVLGGLIALAGHLDDLLQPNPYVPTGPTRTLDEVLAPKPPLTRVRPPATPTTEAALPTPAPATEPRPEPATEPEPAPVTEPEPEPAPATEPLPPPAALTHAPEPAPQTEVVAAAPRRGRAARAIRLAGEARVRRAADARWRPLSAGDFVGEGDEVEALRGPLDLALLPATAGDGTTTAEDERAAGLVPTDRLLLAAGARATLEGSGARLEAGQVVALAREALLLAGPARVLVRGDASLALARGGELQLCALAGEAELSGLRLAARQQVAVDARGKAGKVTPGPATPPAWVAQARLLPGRRLAGAEPGPGHLPLVLGEAVAGASRGVATPAAPAPSDRAVTFGQGTPDGGWRHAAGSTLRLVYRLSGPANLGVTLRDVTRGQDLQALLRGARAGVWTTLDVELDALRGAADRSLRLAPGDLLDLVTVSSHPDAGPVDLEVAELTVVGP